jgi:hypothetical protein
MTCWRSALEDLMRRKCFSSRGITVRLRSVFLRLVACLQVFKDPINTSYARSCIEILGLLFTCIFEGYMGRRINLLTFLSFTTVMYFGISIRGISTITKQVFVFIASFQSVSANILIVLYTLCLSNISAALDDSWIFHSLVKHWGRGDPGPPS